jgi:hypothetical protein
VLFHTLTAADGFRLVLFHTLTAAYGFGLVFLHTMTAADDFGLLLFHICCWCYLTFRLLLVSLISVLLYTRTAADGTASPILSLLPILCTASENRVGKVRFKILSGLMFNLLELIINFAGKLFHTVP